MLGATAQTDLADGGSLEREPLGAVIGELLLDPLIDVRRVQNRHRDAAAWQTAEVGLVLGWRVAQ